VPLQTGPGRDAIAKSVMLCMSQAGLIRGNSRTQHTGRARRSQCMANFSVPLSPLIQMWVSSGHEAGPARNVRMRGRIYAPTAGSCLVHSISAIDFPFVKLYS
jgi:hypothetical protein